MGWHRNHAISHSPNQNFFEDTFVSHPGGPNEQFGIHEKLSWGGVQGNLNWMPGKFLYIKICYIERKYIHVYIVVGVPARVCIYVFKNMRQYITSRTLPNSSYCWIRLPEASITPIIRAVSCEKETLLYEAKQSIAFPFFIQFRQGSFTRDTSHDG